MTASKTRFSAHRQPVMGIAILLVMLCHNQLWFWSDWANQLNTYVRTICQIGVDLFLFSSGYGLYFSYAHASGLVRFYQKRMVRILPAYLSAMLFWSLFSWYFGEDVFAFLDSFALHSFFTKGELIIWYVPAILALYLLYPLAVHLTRSGKATAISCAVVAAVSFYIAVSRAPFLNVPIATVNEVLIVRIPVFLMGTYWGRRSSKGEDASPRIPLWIYAAFAAALAALIIANIHIIQSFSWWWMNRLLFYPLTMCLLGLLLPGLEKTQGNLFYRCLEFLGGITLELYLIQERLLLYLREYILASYQSQLDYVWINILSVVLAIGLAWGLHKLCALPFRRKAALQNTK